jgi:hypothetical protein
MMPIAVPTFPESPWKMLEAAPQAARDALELFDEPCEELAYAL